MGKKERNEGRVSSTSTTSPPSHLFPFSPPSQTHERSGTYPPTASYQSSDSLLALFGKVDFLGNVLKEGNEGRVGESYVPRSRGCFPEKIPTFGSVLGDDGLERGHS